MWCVTPVNPGLMLSAEGFAEQTLTPNPYYFLSDRALPREVT